MRILADENMSSLVVNGLRAAQHDVRWVRDTNPSDEDRDLLMLATQDRRTLITYDTDYGELVRFHRVPAPYGVLLFRIHRDVPREVEAQFIIESVKAWNNWPPGVWTIQIRHSV